MIGKKEIKTYLVFIRDLVFEPKKTIISGYQEKLFGNSKFFYSFVLFSAILISLANIIKHCFVLRNFILDEMIKDAVFEPLFFIASYYFSFYILRFIYDRIVPDKVDNIQLNYILIPVYTIITLVNVLLCLFVNMWFLNLLYILAIPILWVFSQTFLDVDSKIKYFMTFSSIVLILSCKVVRIIFSFFAPNF